MPRYVHANGFEYKKEDLEKYAEADGLSLDDYMSQNNISVDESDDISIIEGLKNEILNTKGEAAKIGYDIWTAAAEGFIKPVLGEEAALFFLGGDVSDKTGWVDPDNGQIVAFDKAAYDRDGYDAVENRRYYELAKENQKYGVSIQQVNVETGEDIGVAYAKMLQQRFNEGKEIEESRRQTVDVGSEGFLNAVKSGEFDDALVAGIGFIKQTAMHAIAARLTLGGSMAATMIGSSWVAYNEQKAKAIYGDDPDGFSKLVENDQDESAIPAALGAIGYVMERAGYKGMMKELAKKSFTGKKAVSLLMTGNKEGVTEYGQGLTERLNENLGKQMSLEESVKDVGSYMWTEEAWDNYFAGLIGGTGMTGGGKIVQGALRSDPTSNQFVNKKINNIAGLTESMAKATSEKELKDIQDQIQIEETDLKDYLESNKKLSEYLNEGEITSLTDLVNERRNTSAEIVSFKKGLNKGAISQASFDIQVKDLFESLNNIDAKVKNIKVDANMRLLKADLDSGDVFVGDVKGLEQVRYETNEEFLKALEKEYKLQGIKMPDMKKVRINGTKIGNKLLINMEVAAEQNAVATSTHEVLHGIVKSTLQADDASGNLSAKGENMVKMFINQIGSSTLAKIEKELEKGGYKLNDDGTEKDFKEYGEEYLTIYAQLSKAGALNKNSLQKAASWFTNLWNNNSDFKEIGFETGEQIQNFLDAYVQDTKKGKFRQEFKDLAALGVKMKGGKVDFSKTQKDVAKKTLDDIGKAENFDASNKEITNQLPAMVKVQVDNYFNNRPSLKADKSVREEVQAEILFRLINPSKTGRTDINGFKPKINDSLYGYLNKKINYRMLDTFKENPTIVPDFTKVDLEDAAKFLTTGDATTTKKTEGVKTKLVQTKARQLTSLADLDIENETVIVDGAKTTILKEVAKKQLNKIIEESPANTVEQIEQTLIPDLAEFIRKEMGVIGQKDGKLNIPESYKAYLANTYEQTVSSMEILKIRTNYKNLFKRENMGFADYKTKKSDKPSLKKDSNYRKEIFRNITTKAEFTKYHTEGKKNKLIANQRNLALMRAEAEAVRAAENYIQNNSTNPGQLFSSSLRTFVDSKTVEKQKLEDKSFDSVKYSKEIINTTFLISDAYMSNKNVFDNNGKLLPPYNGFLKDKKTMQSIGDFVWANTPLLQGYQSFNQFIKRAYDKLADAGQRGTDYERNLIDAAITVEKTINDPKIFKVISREPNEKDANPDVVVEIHGVQMNIEAKMFDAQYGSFTHSVVNKDGKQIFNVKKEYSPELKKILKELEKETLKGIEAARKFLKSPKDNNGNNKQVIEWDGIKIIPTEGHNQLLYNINPETGKSYFRGIGATIPFPLKYIAELYNLKKHEVYLIQLMGRGLFSMGGDIYGFGLTSLESGGDGFVTMRVSSNTYKTAATEADAKNMPNKSMFKNGKNGKKWKVPRPFKKYAFRSFPGINKQVLDKMQSPQTVENIAGIQKIINDKRVQMGLEAIKFSKTLVEKANESEGLYNAINFSRTIHKPKGITVLDFDDTLATTKSLVKYTTPDGKTGTLNAEQYASTYESLLDKGYEFDFSDFNKVVKGKLAPLFNKAIKLQGKFGPENMFVLTARPPESAQAIFDFLKANGLNIPLKNITGLANSTSEAKALWIAGKVGEGYNDFYFADDALQNVQAVKNMLDQFDVKSKVQQAKVKFSKTLSDDFNDILQDVTGIESGKRFSTMKARKRGASKGKFRFFIPPSHEDFIGLLYNFMGKGRKGDVHRDFFEKALVRPLNRAYREIDTAKQAIANDYKALGKQMPDVRKMLTKKTPDGDYTYQDAIRVYLWDKHGYSIPGLSEADQKSLVDIVKQDPNLQAYAESINAISKQENYVDPGPNWETGNIRIDLIDATGRVGRAKYFAEFQENADTIFSEENLNKIEAAYGKSVREALEDMLYRIKIGVNRSKGANAKPNMFMNWLNASVSGVMFFNTRSALLQQMSNVNYLNFADNNILAAGKAFANQPQYWKDFAMIFNSDMLKQRRGGLQTDINGAELAEAIKSARPGSLFDQIAIIVGKALKLGFLPTQIGDNIAIATGGAAFYRNRVNKYIREGFPVDQAEKKAFTDFQNITQSTQQSARPDMTSYQQAIWVGKLVLNFLNTPSQYNRIIKKAGLDLLNRRITPPNTTQTQSDMSNMSRILYYGAAQNLIFYSLQTALFAVMFGSEDEDEDEKAEQFLKKKERVINGTIDTILRGSGIYGVAVSTLKNMAIKFMEQREAGYNKDESAVIMELLNFSPVVGIKARRIVNAEKTLNYNKKVIEEMETFDIDNPVWSAVTNYTQTITTAPTNKIYQKTINLRNAADRDYTALQRLLFLSGYTTWSLGLGDTKKMKKIKEEVKAKNKKKRKRKSKSVGF